MFSSDESGEYGIKKTIDTIVTDKDIESYERRYETDINNPNSTFGVHEYTEYYYWMTLKDSNNNDKGRY